MAGLPPSYGLGVVSLHNKAEGPTLPSNNRVPSSDFVAVITGAGKGIGYHIALSYAQAGARGLVVSSRTQSDLDQLTKQLKGINSSIEVLALVSDASKKADVDRLAAETHKRFGRADVVVANAGVFTKEFTAQDGSTRTPANILEDDDFERVIDINFIGTYYLAKAFVPLLKSTPNGAKAFIAITSVVSHFPSSGFSPVSYNVSKLAQNRLIESLHNDFHQDTDLTFYAVHPGVVATPAVTLLTGLSDGSKWDACKLIMTCTAVNMFC